MANPPGPKAPKPPQTDVIGFARIFVLFCTLVLVPALFLSGFGVIAILNERSIAFHRATGWSVSNIEDYAGPARPRVVFHKTL